MPVPMSRVPFQLTPAGRPPTFLVLLLVTLAMTGAAMHRGTPAHPTADGDDAAADPEPEEAVGEAPLGLDLAAGIVLGATALLAVVIVLARRPRKA